MALLPVHGTVPGARALLEWLKMKGYAVAVYANTVPSLREHLDRQGLGSFVDFPLPCNEVGFVKPDVEVIGG